MPLIFLIHELGHAFFVKIFGGQVTKITLGLLGKRILSVGIFQVNLWYFLGGKAEHRNLKIGNKFARGIILIGGLIFNIVSIILINKLGSLYNPKFMYTMVNDLLFNIMRAFVTYSIIIVIINALPIKLFSMNTDGRQLYQLIRYGNSKLYDDGNNLGGRYRNE